MAGKRVFTTLDGLRGVAALMVLVFHLLPAWPGLPFPRSAFLSVDLFFLLSGFVIGHAYDDRLAGGMSVRHFVELRVARLYPLYILGCALGLTAPVALALASGQWWAAKPTVTAVPWALAMLPRVGADQTRWFLLNPPAWSLFSELLVNILYAAIFPFLSRRVLAGIVMGSGATFAGFLVLHGGMTGEIHGWEHLFGNARVIFSFSAGLLLYRMWCAGRLPSPKMPAEALIALFVVMLTVPPTGAAGVALTMCVLAIGFPLLLTAAIANEPSGRNAVAMTALGRLSYPLYALHYPLFTAMCMVTPARNLAIGGIGVAVAAVLVAWLAMRHYDPRARAWLGRALATLRSPVRKPLTHRVGIAAPGNG